MGRRRDDDERARRGEAASARVQEELREARDEVFRAYVRAREQARSLAEATDRGERTQRPPPSRDQKR